MKQLQLRRFITLLVLAVTVFSLVSAPLTAYAYPGGYSNTHSNTGDQRSDVAAIAKTQVGYKEDSSGTKYGAWYKSYLNTSYNYTTAPWCAMFAMWCVYQAGATKVVKAMSASSTAMLKSFKAGTNGSAAYSFSSGYVPRPGDIIFVGYSGSSEVNHVGLVTGVDDTWIYTVEGNHNNAVCSLKYKRSTGQRNNSSRYIKNFGVPAYTCDTSAVFNTGSGSSSGSSNSGSGSSSGKTVSYSTTVTASSLNVRSSASPTASVVKTLSSGTSVKIVQEAEGSDKHLWGKLSDNTGWICLYHAACGDLGHGAPSVTGESIIQTGVINCSSLNIREKATSSSSCVGTLARGAKVSLVEKKTVSGTEWGRVAGDGWVCLTYVKLDAPSTKTVQETVTAAGCTGAGIIGTVSASNLNVRATAGYGSIVGVIKKGSSVTVYETKSADSMLWGRTSSGWVSMSYITLPTYEVSADGVHVREKAGTSYDILKTIVQGTKLSIDQVAEVNSVTWGHITTGGWVSMAYIAESKPKTSDGAAPSAGSSGSTSGSSSTGNTASGSTATETAPAAPSDAIFVGTAVADLKIREKPVTGYANKTLKKGTTVYATEVTKAGEDLWGKVEGGWVCLSYVTTTSLTVTVTSSSMYIRSDAGAWSSVKGFAKEGDTFTLDKYKMVDKSFWGHITTGGWLCLDFVNIAESKPKTSGETAPSGSSTSDSNSGSSSTGNTASGSTATETAPAAPSDAIFVGTAVADLKIREKPVTGYANKTLKKGTTVYATEVTRAGEDLWGKVEGGWVCLSYVTTTSLTVTVTSSSMYIRSDAGAWSSVKGFAKEGDTFTLDKYKTVDKSLWGHITTGGWICLDFVKYGK